MRLGLGGFLGVPLHIMEPHQNLAKIYSPQIIVDTARKMTLECQSPSCPKCSPPHPGGMNRSQKTEESTSFPSPFQTFDAPPGEKCFKTIFNQKLSGFLSTGILITCKQTHDYIKRIILGMNNQSKFPIKCRETCTSIGTTNPPHQISSHIILDSGTLHRKRKFEVEREEEK